MSFFSFFGCAKGSTSEIRTVEPSEFQKDIGESTEHAVLDVRTPKEYAQGHIADAINIDWLNRSSFDAAVAKLSKAPVYYIYCRSGRRSHEAAEYMQQHGFNVVDLEGGILAWQTAGLPEVK